MNREHFHQVPPPRNRLSAAAEFHPRHFNDRPVRHVLPRNPFRVIQSQRPSRHRNLHMRMQNFLRRLRCIHHQPYWRRRTLCHRQIHRSAQKYQRHHAHHHSPHNPSHPYLHNFKSSKFSVGTSKSLQPHLPHQKSQNPRILFKNLTHRTSFAMPQLRIIQKQNRLISALRRLHRRRHLPCVQRSHARITIPRQKQNRRILRPRHHVVIRRISQQSRELASIFRRPVLRHPIFRHEKLLITHHVQQRIPAHNRAKKLRPLRHRRSHQ